MTSPQFSRQTHRARARMERMTASCRAAWDQMSAARTNSDRDWDEVVYLPSAAAMEAVVNHLPRQTQQAMIGLHNASVAEQVQAAALVETIITIGIWRMTQGIFRFDPTLYDALIDTPVTGEVPGSALRQLPQWCVYIETPGLTTPAITGGVATVYGAWVRLDTLGAAELGGSSDTFLTIALDADSQTIGHQRIPLAGTIEDAIAEALADWSYTDGAHTAIHTAIVDYTSKVISLLLYLCTDDPDLTRRGKPDTPANPQPKRTRRRGWQLFPASGPLEWDVGVRIGSALRAAYQREQTGGDAAPSGRSVRPHVRRAHWHTFLSGPRLRDDGTAIPSDQRRRDVRWIPPLGINVADLGSMPSTIIPVQL